MRSLIFLLAACVSFGSAANAASFLARTSFGALGCEEVSSGQAAVSAECVSYIVGALEATSFSAAGNGATSAFCVRDQFT